LAAERAATGTDFYMTGVGKFYAKAGGLIAAGDGLKVHQTC
jgi:hypothetical protein